MSIDDNVMLSNIIRYSLLTFRYFRLGLHDRHGIDKRNNEFSRELHVFRILTLNLRDPKYITADCNSAPSASVSGRESDLHVESLQRKLTVLNIVYLAVLHPA